VTFARFPLTRRRYVSLEALLGLLMLPLSAVPIILYLAKTPDGYLMYLRGRYALLPPATAKLDPATRATATAAFSRLPVDGVPVIVYHGVGRAGSEDPSGRYVVSRAHFAEQMRALQAAGFHAVNVEDVARYVRSGDRSLLPAKPVLITFDDGRTDAMLQADPVLRDTGMRATMFVIGADAASASPFYVNWHGLQGYVSTGRWQLENHTYDLHKAVDDVKGLVPISELVRVRVGETPRAFERRIAADLDHEQQDVASHVGSAPIAFSYPFGDWGQHPRTPWVAAALRHVLASRFRVAFDQDRQAGWRFAMPGDDPLHLHRLQVQNWTGAEFIDRLVAAGKLSETAFRERGLDVAVSRRSLVNAAVDATCAPLQPGTVESRETSKRVVGLSFSGGPSPYTPQVLDLLERYHAHATFFVIGENLLTRSRILERMLVTGNEIGNGTWSAAHPASLTDTELARDLRRTNAEIGATVPFQPCLTRAPYREQVGRFGRIARTVGLTDALWSVDPRDFDSRSPVTIVSRVLDDVRPGSVVILHDGGTARWATVQALKVLLEDLEQRGYRVESISQLLTEGA
jgi:peptidoglycan-N-acetylglucosamine deacetylase